MMERKQRASQSSSKKAVHDPNMSIQAVEQEGIARYLLCCTPRNGDCATAYSSKSRSHRLPFRSVSSVEAATRRQPLLPGRVIVWVLSPQFMRSSDALKDTGPGVCRRMSNWFNRGVLGRVIKLHYVLLANNAPARAMKVPSEACHDRSGLILIIQEGLLNCNCDIDDHERWHALYLLSFCHRGVLRCMRLDDLHLDLAAVGGKRVCVPA